jgi:hypothetical protein
MILLRRRCFEYQFCRDRDRRFQSAIDRAAVGEETVHTICGISVRLFGLQFQDDVDAANHEDVIFELNFSDRFRHQSSIRSIYLTRLQRAPEGSDQSTRRSRDDVIQRRGVRFQDGRRNLVVLCHGAMRPKQDGLLFRRKISSAQRTLHALDAHIGPVNDVGHYCRMVPPLPVRFSIPENVSRTDF